MTSVNTNNMAAMATRSSRAANAGQAQNIERLSTGLRVNSASDDAAGLAIAKNMEKQVSGYEVNIRNANDAISLVQIAEGGMDVIGDMLQRMKDLALQSANGTNSTSQRANIQEEYSALMSEIDRIVATTEFNGINLLDGSFSQNFQVDEKASGDNVIGVSISELNTSALSAKTGEVAFANIQADSVFSGAETFTITPDLNDAGTPAGPVTISVTANTTASQFVDLINARSADTEVTAAIIGSDLVLYNNNINSGGAAPTTFAQGASVTLGGSGLDAGVASLEVATSTALSATDISTSAASSNAITVLDGAIEQLTTGRAQLGASQNRFEKTIDNLSSKIANVNAAKGRIMDADFATESTDLAKNKVLVQAATSMLAQANQDGQNVLALLR